MFDDKLLSKAVLAAKDAFEKVLLNSDCSTYNLYNFAVNVTGYILDCEDLETVLLKISIDTREEHKKEEK